MNLLFGLALASAWDRRFVLSMLILSIALSTSLLLGIERIQHQIRVNVSQSVSGTDLILGARTGASQLLLYSVFHLGSATPPIRWSSVQALSQHPAVRWTIPVALGDSHRGFAVLATSAAYFEHFRYGEQQPLTLAAGQVFEQKFDLVLGAEVAQRLGYQLGQSVVLSHGDGSMVMQDHHDHPFKVVGILRPTGTAVDRTLHIGLTAMEAIHQDWMGGIRRPAAVRAKQAVYPDRMPKTLTAVLIGLKNRAAALSFQYQVQQFEAEPLMAILPTVVLDELWQVLAVGERSLQGISLLVSLISLAGLIAVMTAGLDARRRELAILRSLGAGPVQILGLLVWEAALVTLSGILLGGGLLLLAVLGLEPLLWRHFSLALPLSAPSVTEWGLLAMVLVSGLIAGSIPAWRAYHLASNDAVLTGG